VVLDLTTPLLRAFFGGVVDVQAGAELLRCSEAVKTWLCYVQLDSLQDVESRVLDGPVRSWRSILLKHGGVMKR
jgi:hypothetical protein